MNNKLSNAIRLAAAGSLSVSLPAVAEINLGGDLVLASDVSIDTVYDSNIFSRSTSLESAWLAVVSPSVALRSEGEQTSAELSYQMFHGEYLDIDLPEYTDHDLLAAARWSPVSYLSAGVSAGYQDLHEDLGFAAIRDGDRAPGSVGLVETAPSKHRSMGGDVRLGSNASPLQLELAVSQQDDDFADDFRDVEWTGYSALLDFRVGARKSILLEARNNDIEYREQSALSRGVDSTETVLLLGYEWEGAKTRASIKAGRLDKDFGDQPGSDYEGTQWEVALSWSPKSYSRFSLFSSRTPRETITSDTGSFIEQTMHTVAWTQDWTSALQSSVAYSLSDSEFVGEGTSGSNTRTSAQVSYRWSPQTRIAFAVSTLETDAITGIDSIERTQATLGITLSL